jgi:DNA-binding transcriptional LysR family regulator
MPLGYRAPIATCLRCVLIRCINVTFPPPTAKFRAEKDQACNADGKESCDKQSLKGPEFFGRARFPFLSYGTVSRRMELRHMRYFVAVAEEKNFTRAAARLHLAQPSLSRQVRDLENELGVSLLRRGKGGLTLTAAGKEYLAQARKLLEDSATAVRVTQAAGRSEHRQLVIGSCEPPLASGLLATILKTFSMAHPNVRVETREYVSVEQHRHIAARELDAGFGYRPPEDPSLYESFTVSESPHVAALPADHPLTRKKELFLRDLAGEPFVQFPRWLWPQRADAIAQKCADAGFTMRVVQEAQPMHSLLNFVGRGFGVSIVPDPICWPAPGVVFKKLQDFDLTASFQLTWLRRNDSTLLRDFIAITRRVASNLGPGLSSFGQPKRAATKTTDQIDRLVRAAASKPALT